MARMIQASVLKFAEDQIPTRIQTGNNTITATEARETSSSVRRSPTRRSSSRRPRPVQITTPIRNPAQPNSFSGSDSSTSCSAARLAASSVRPMSNAVATFAVAWALAHARLRSSTTRGRKPTLRLASPRTNNDNPAPTSKHADSPSNT